MAKTAKAAAEKKKKVKKMNKHKQLKKLGIDPSVFFDDAKKKKPEKYLRKEMKKYGCTQREVYNFDMTMAMWLYEHLVMYRDYASGIIVLDEEGGLYEVPVAYEKDKTDEELYDGYTKRKEPVLETKREEKSLGECIDLMICYLKRYIANDDDDDSSEFLFSEAKKIEYLKCALNIMAEVAPALWV